MKRKQAVDAANELRAITGVRAVCIYGSVARGSAGEDSDIDIIVLGSDPELKPSRLYRLLSNRSSGSGVALSYYTRDRLNNYLNSASRFAKHLKKEAWIVHDEAGELAQILSVDREVDSQREISRQLRQLRSLRHVERFGGRFLFPLAHVYRIGRTTTYARLADVGVFEFDQDSAFDSLVYRFPQLQESIEIVRRLAPFYVSTRKRNDASVLPFDPNGPRAEEEFDRGYNAVVQIADQEA